MALSWKTYRAISQSQGLKLAIEQILDAVETHKHVEIFINGELIAVREGEK